MIFLREFTFELKLKKIVHGVLFIYFILNSILENLIIVSGFRIIYKLDQLFENFV